MITEFFKQIKEAASKGDRKARCTPPKTYEDMQAMVEYLDACKGYTILDMHQLSWIIGINGYLMEKD